MSFLVSGLTACTVGAPAPGGPTAEPEVEPSGSATVHEGEEAAPPTAESQPRARWTVFVYAKGDGGRSPDLAADLARMSQAKLGPDVKVVVLADWNAALTDVDGHSFPSGSNWIALSGSGARATVARDVEQDLDDPAVLRAAIARAFRDHPADRHGLVVWTRSEAGDVQDGTRPGAKAMSIPTMKDAIRGGLDDAGLSGERPLDFIGFDTFAQARVESAYAMRDLAQVHVLNTARSSGSTWAYEDALSFLAAHDDASGPSFAAFEASAAAKDGARAHAAVATASLDDLAAATSSLVQAVVDSPLALPRVLSAAAATALHAKQTGRAPSYAQFVAALASGPPADVVTMAARVVEVRLAQTFVGAVDDGVDLAFALPGLGGGTDDDLEAAQEWRAATGWDALVETLGGSGGDSEGS